MIHHGDCLAILPTLEAESIDAIVTDPPYGLGFMGKAWDAPDGPGGLGDMPMRRRSEMNKVNTGVSRQGGRQRSTADFAKRQSRDAREYQAWCETWAAECFRVAKPGAHLLAFGGTRTYHRLASAIEDAGWEIRDTLVWAYASGFPKSLDVSKAIDKANGKHARDLAAFGDYIRSARVARGMTLRALDDSMGTNTAASWWEGRKAGVQPPGVATYQRLKIILGLDDRYDEFVAWAEAERQKIGERVGAGNGSVVGLGSASSMSSVTTITAPATDAAREWQGWGTALKPAWEPIVMARKPLRGTVAANVLAHGTGALNIDGTRIGTTVETWPVSRSYAPGQIQPGGVGVTQATGDAPAGRWPANVILTDPIFDGEVPGVVGGGWQSGGGNPSNRIAPNGNGVTMGGSWTPGATGLEAVDTEGTYSRFFLVPKAARSDREPVLGGLPTSVVNITDGHGRGPVNTSKGDGSGIRENHPRANVHPTVKPTELMRHLVRLVTPPGGLVLDPFLGSGTTALAAEAEGFRWLGIEREAEYVAIAEARLNGTQRGLGLA